MSFYTFLNTLLDKYKCYSVSLPYYDNEIPINLQYNVENLKEFKSMLYHLSKKSYIYTKDRSNNDALYKRWVIPMGIFLHYMHVDYRKLNDIHVFLVNENDYKKRASNYGGEYGYSNNKNDENIHVIYVKVYNDPFLNKKYPYISFFHELLHMIDNIDFQYDYSTKSLDYDDRDYEINAKYISNIFYYVYEYLRRVINDKLTKNYFKHTLYPALINYIDDLLSLKFHMQDMLYWNFELLELSDTDNITATYFHLSHQNILYLQSLRKIDQILDIYTNLIGVFQK